MAYWDELEKHTDWDEIWMNHPLVRSRINRRVTGNSAQWPLLWFRDRMLDRTPFATAVSVGCGVGNLERSLLQHGIVSSVVGIDTSPAAIEEAKARAVAAGLERNIRYEVVDSRDFLANQRELPAVFFHASLHHFDRLDEFLGSVRGSLRSGGILYIDEYVGPSRGEWSLGRMAVLNCVYRLLPKRARRVRLIRRPVNADDPTEAVQSSGIHRAIERHFRILERRDYGGNLLAVLYPALQRPRAPDDPLAPVFDECVELLLDLEDLAMRYSRLLNESSFQSVVIAEVPATG